MTAEEIEFVASHASLICLEKGHAGRQFKFTEDGIEQEAQPLKTLNPDMKVIFYWNTLTLCIDEPVRRTRDVGSVSIRSVAFAREAAVGEIAKVTDRAHWRRWTPTKTLNFKEPERRSRTTVVFRSGEWLLRVKSSDVRIHDGIRWKPMN